MFKKKAFTLAEVLITLGIVGTIATITLPSLMNNILVQELEAQFKKTVSDLHSFARYFQAQNDISVPLSKEICQKFNISTSKDFGLITCRVLPAKSNCFSFSKFFSVIPQSKR